MPDLSPQGRGYGMLSNEEGIKKGDEMNQCDDSSHAFCERLDWMLDRKLEKNPLIDMREGGEYIQEITFVDWLGGLSGIAFIVLLFLKALDNWS